MLLRAFTLVKEIENNEFDDRFAYLPPTDFLEDCTFLFHSEAILHGSDIIVDQVPFSIGARADFALTYLDANLAEGQSES